MGLCGVPGGGVAFKVLRRIAPAVLFRIRTEHTMASSSRATGEKRGSAGLEENAALDEPAQRALGGDHRLFGVLGVLLETVDRRVVLSRPRNGRFGGAPRSFSDFVVPE